MEHYIEDTSETVPICKMKIGDKFIYAGERYTIVDVNSDIENVVWGIGDDNVIRPFSPGYHVNRLLPVEEVNEKWEIVK